MNLATKTEKIIDGNLYRATMTLHGDFNKKAWNICPQAWISTIKNWLLAQVQL